VSQRPAPVDLCCREGGQVAGVGETRALPGVRGGNRLHAHLGPEPRVRGGHTASPGPGPGLGGHGRQVLPLVRLRHERLRAVQRQIHRDDAMTAQGQLVRDGQPIRSRTVRAVHQHIRTRSSPAPTTVTPGSGSGSGRARAEDSATRGEAKPQQHIPARRAPTPNTVIAHHIFRRHTLTLGAADGLRNGVECRNGLGQTPGDVLWLPPSGGTTPWTVPTTTSLTRGRPAADTKARHSPVAHASGPGASDPPGPVTVSNSASDLSGRRGGEPVGGCGMGQEQRLRLMGGAVLDDVNAAPVRAALPGGAGYRGEALPGFGRDPRRTTAAVTSVPDRGAIGARGRWRSGRGGRGGQGPGCPGARRGGRCPRM
jgi:hypothetical protein